MRFLSRVQGIFATNTRSASLSSFSSTSPRESAELAPRNQDGYIPLFHPKEPHRSHVRSRILIAIIAILVFFSGYSLGRYFIPHSAFTLLPPPGVLHIPFRITVANSSPKDTPPPPSPSLILSLPTPIPEPTEPEVQPNIVHYVYGMSANTSSEATFFPYFRYLAVRSALLTLKPTTTYFHYHTLPTGPWFDLLKPNLTLWHIPDITSIFNNTDNPRPVRHYAHKADVARLQVLMGLGGTYLDVDTFVLRDFGSAGLREMDMVMGVEADPSPWRGDWDPSGLCNAVILSKRDSTFLRRWWDSYRTFDEEQWAEHSVYKPLELSKDYPSEITILSSRAMFWPLWDDESLKLVHESNDYDFFKTGQLAYHSWESRAKKWLLALTPSSVSQVNTSFNRMARRFMDVDVEFQVERAERRRAEIALFNER